MLQTTATSWQGKVSPYAANVLQDYLTNGSVPASLPEDVKKEVWVATVALGMTPLGHALYSEKEIQSGTFKRTICRLKDWYDIKTESDKVFQALTTLCKLEAKKGTMFTYSVNIWDYSFSSHIATTLSSAGTDWERAMRKWNLWKMNPPSPFYIGGPEKDTIPLDESVRGRRDMGERILSSDMYGAFYPDFQAIQDTAVFLLLQLTQNENTRYCKPRINVDEILDGSTKWRKKVSSQITVVLTEYLNHDKLPDCSKYTEQEKKDLWLASWSLGQTVLMRHIFSPDQMDQPSFCLVLKEVLEYIDFDKPEQAIMALSILAYAHESHFEYRKRRGICSINQAFYEFLVLHDDSIKPLFDAWLVMMSKIKYLDVLSLSQNKFCFNKETAPQIFSSKGNCRPADLASLFKEVKFSEQKVPISLQELMSFSSKPDEVIKRLQSFETKTMSFSMAKLLQEQIKEGNCKLSIFLKEQPGTLTEFLEIAKKLHLDLLPEKLASKVFDLSWCTIVGLDPRSVQEIMDHFKPHRMALIHGEWLNFMPTVWYLHAGEIKSFNELKQQTPVNGITHLEFSYSPRNITLDIAVLERIFPNVEAIWFNSIPTLISLPEYITKVRIDQFPLGDRYDETCLAVVSNLNHLQTLLLDRCRSTVKVDEKNDCSEQVFEEIASLPNLTTFYVCLPHHVSHAALSKLSHSKTLKHIYVDKEVDFIKSIVGEGVEVKQHLLSYKDFSKAEFGGGVAYCTLH